MVLGDDDDAALPKPRKADRTTVTRKACGAVVGVAFLAASVALTGTMQLAATDEERRDIGGALSDALAYFDDTAPFVKLLNFMGPWSGVIDGLSKAVYDRAVYIAQHRIPPPGFRRPSPPPPFANGRSAPLSEEDIVAPDPGLIT